MAHERQQQQFQIRSLPRKNERKPDESATQKPAAVKSRRWIIYVGTASLALLAGAFLLPLKKPASRSMAQATNFDQEASAKISRHMQDARLKQEMMRQRLKIEDLRAKDAAVGKDAVVLAEPERALGVQMDQEDTSDKLYRDLNYRRKPLNTDHLPDERISARVANRKWINQHERAERINFVRNFIRSAYDRGYQVELDQNLVVVGVKRITEPKKVNIEQVIDRMARQGL